MTNKILITWICFKRIDIVVVPGDGDSEGEEADALDERPPELVAVEALHESYKFN